MQIFLDYINSFILGIIQGITEWLPVSSTGHLIIWQEFTGTLVSESFAEMFEVVVQFGSILAVVVLFWSKLFPFSPSKTASERKEVYNLWLKVIIAVIPAGVIGVLFDDKINEVFFNPYTVAATLIIYGVLFIVIENRNKLRKPATDALTALTYKTAFLIGMFQILALIPGTSRSGTTILGAVILGCSRYVAAEFSFFMAVPVMLGASALKLLKHGLGFTAHEFMILAVGMITAFVVSILALKFLVGYVRKHDFKAFGVYRIALGVVIILYFVLKSCLYA
ncbi:MAG: undecaprenyl-diphosphate phosphatase [Ruminococcaceae bacterium]|nr:undecaprenyl-diphosphate phosphatase [Oscillospiraceae bacterium]